jgi:hypothetical protein
MNVHILRVLFVFKLQPPEREPNVLNTSSVDLNLTSRQLVARLFIACILQTTHGPLLCSSIQ